MILRDKTKESARSRERTRITLLTKTENTHIQNICTYKNKAGKKYTKKIGMCKPTQPAFRTHLYVVERVGGWWHVEENMERNVGKK